MTKKVNRYFTILSVAYLILIVAIPFIDYIMSKKVALEKGDFQTSTEYKKSIEDCGNAIGLDITCYVDFYTFFHETYSKVNQSSIIVKAINNLRTIGFKEILTWEDYDVTGNGATLYFMYLFDKIIWVLIIYCIFVIPISMVDLFYKMIKKEVD